MNFDKTFKIAQSIENKHNMTLDNHFLCVREIKKEYYCTKSGYIITKTCSGKLHNYQSSIIVLVTNTYIIRIPSFLL